jgi:hypothetical protein
MCAYQKYPGPLDLTIIRVIHVCTLYNNPLFYPSSTSESNTTLMKVKAKRSIIFNWLILDEKNKQGHPRPLWPQSTCKYGAPQCMSPRRHWDSPNPSPASECALPPPGRAKGWGGEAHSPAAKGVGESQFRQQEKRLSTLPTLCWWHKWQAGNHRNQRAKSIEEGRGQCIHRHPWKLYSKTCSAAFSAVQHSPIPTC